MRQRKKDYVDSQISYDIADMGLIYNVIYIFHIQSTCTYVCTVLSTIHILCK